MSSTKLLEVDQAAQVLRACICESDCVMHDGQRCSDPIAGGISGNYCERCLANILAEAQS